MTVALVVAGGTGVRMGLDIPKQFAEVEGKPVLMYTLEPFQSSPEIDAIAVVLIAGWEDRVRSWAETWGIRKLRWIIPGGETVQESLRNGVFYLENHLKGQDVVVVHDGIRPLVDGFVLANVLDVCRLHGNAVTAMPYTEQVFVMDDEASTVRYIPRETLRRVATPQAYRFDLLDEKYHEAFEKGIGIYGSSYTNTMMTDLGVRLYFAAGSDRNIKLTTAGELEFFRAFVRENRR